MRILLIVPTHLYKFRFPEPLSITDFPTGLAYVAAALKAAGHDVHGLNANNHPDFPDAKTMLRELLQRKLAEVKPDLICMGGICVDYAFLKDAINLVRKLAPDVPVVLGGGIITYDGEFIFKTLQPDFAIVGEADHTIVRLADALQRKERLGDIPNLIYREHGATTLTRADFNYGDINRLAFPDYGPFNPEEMFRFALAARYLYRYPRADPRPMVLVAGRSCPFSCTFCVHAHGAEYRARKIDNVVQELAQMHQKYQFNLLVILDELFAVKRDRLRQFSEAIIEGRKTFGWDFNWMFQTHASANFDRETLAVAKEAGCYCFGYGLESGSPTVLKSMNKRTTPAQVLKGITAGREAGVGFVGGLIFGDPAENPTTLRESMDFLRDHCGGLHIGLGGVQPYPGSQLFEQCLERGLIPNKRHYYEAIDERRYNMTVMPAKPWTVWLGLLGFFGGLGFWLKSSRAAVGRPLAHGPLEVTEFSTTCPHCHHPFVYTHARVREPKQAWSVATPQGNLMGWLLKLRHRPWFIYGLFQLIRVWSWRRNWFGLLRVFRPRPIPNNAMISGCPACNRSLRLEW